MTDQLTTGAFNWAEVPPQLLPLGGAPHPARFTSKCQKPARVRSAADDAAVTMGSSPGRRSEKDEQLWTTIANRLSCNAWQLRSSAPRFRCEPAPSDIEQNQERQIGESPGLP